MASPGDRRANALQISLVHFLFNISGILLWYPVPCTRIPIRLAKGLGNVTASHRCLSLAGRSVLVGVGAPLLTMLLIILLINILQKRKPVFLPPGLRSWSFLPLWARSLDPWDRVVEVFTAMCCCWCKCCHLAAAVEQERPEQRAAEREQQERQQRGGHEPCDVGRDAGGNETEIEERV
ncbi:Sodium-dependent phosphate transport protein 2B [Takifugu flavidus]|uniref:Sodium-dependent phosphate transport protein 2B n=1 Tax=Takifugu flavidus TaxID=433684 RepID=A0A5C6MT51_9TELE|nr:Sodium-dependent phosphate transport protein 2B [Takifugu flavidus]